MTADAIAACTCIYRELSASLYSNDDIVEVVELGRESGPDSTRRRYPGDRRPNPLFQK